MPKFVKTAAGLALFSMAWWKKYGLGLFSKNKDILKFLKLDNLDPKVFIPKFMTMLQDPQFQDIVFSILISAKDENGDYLLKNSQGKPLEISPDALFKDINYYFKTQGTQVGNKPTASVAEGAYQSVFRNITKPTDIPKGPSIDSVFSDLKKITSTPNFKEKSPGEKKEILKNFSNRLAGGNQELINMVNKAFTISDK